MEKKEIIISVETSDYITSDDNDEDIIELYERIEKLYNVDSLELIYEQGVDIPCKENMEYLIELRDLINRLPEEIVLLGQKRVAGYPLTDAERKQLERFRKYHRNGGSEDIF